MSEYITEWYWDEMRNAPNQDQREEIVRCRDCRFARPEPKSDIKSRKPYQGGYWCDELSEGIGLFCDPDCFCAWGERSGS